MSANSSQFSIAEKRNLLSKITALSRELKALTPRASAASPSSALHTETDENGEDLSGLKAELCALEAEAGGRGRGGRWSTGRGYRGGRGSRGRGGFIRGSRLPDDDPVVLQLEAGNSNYADIKKMIGGEKMKATKTLQHWLYDKNKMPPPSTDQIHVLVELPTRAGAMVVYESGDLKKRFLFAHNVVAQGSQQDFVLILDQPTTYYIVDGVKPAYYDAKTILLTSPRRSIWYEFNKTNCRSCYMPVWSLKEILKCRELIYSDTPVAVVQDCFRRWGGIARYVLRFAQVGDQQVLLEKAMDIVDLDGLVNACGQLDANDAQVSNRLLHYRVNKIFDSEYFVFASKYVQQAVYKRLYKKDKRKLLEFIAASDGVVWRLVDDNNAYDDDDDIVEGEWDSEDEDADDDMNADDDVAMEECTGVALVDDGAATVISLSKSEKAVVFSHGCEIVAAANTSYLQPTVKNYQSVDAIIKPDLCSR
ncbi:CRN-like protein [Plasmopara halstedii]|uniref:CRN-like protein n=1 Tax=Plasmopara halstedii TaxID=4781 RepID=A0A0N7L673_PLAHL|nr:CRN-like protein [Plasmopara halstedii]CEG43475.1 CRN-like protein [Plasmopara halstedii]|eukprot:XP_024579844.1 CRN-like protein [Plasmopara halstedii]